MNFITDLVNAAVVSPLFNAQSIAATTSGTGADYQGAAVRNQEFAICQAGANAGTYVVQIEESNLVGSGYTSIVGATVTFVTGDANTVKIIPFFRALRYIRATLTLSAAGTGLFAVVGVSQKLRTGGTTLVP